MEQKEKIEFIDMHFFYEVQELLNAKFFLRKVMKGEVVYNLTVSKYYKEHPEEFVKWLGALSMNMAIEHSLLHARILYEFYFMPKPNPHEHPRAIMFVPDFQVPAFTANIKEDFSEKVNNQITHLGSKRFEEASKKFSASETIAIINDLLRITKKFLERLPEEYHTEKLKELIKNMDDLIKT